MARTKGSFNLAGAIEPLAAAPLDARAKVNTKSDLTNSESFPYHYIGLETYVVSENKKYRLIGEDPTSLSNWQEIGSGGSGGASSLSELTDVNFGTLANGDLIKYNATTGKWENVDGNLVVEGYARTEEISSAIAFINKVNQVSDFPDIIIEDPSIFDGKDFHSIVVILGPTQAHVIFAGVELGYQTTWQMSGGQHYIYSKKKPISNEMVDGYRSGVFNYTDGLTSLTDITMTYLNYTDDLNYISYQGHPNHITDNDKVGWVYVKNVTYPTSGEGSDYADRTTELTESFVFYADEEHTIVITPEIGKFYKDNTSGNTYYWNGGRYILVSGGSSGETYTAGDGINISAENEISTDNLQEGDMDDIVNPLPVPGGGGSGGSAALESDVTSNMAVGAIANGTTLTEGTSFTEFVQKLLITEIAPTIAFSISKSGNVAYGGSYTETLTVNVSNMGTAKKIKTIEWYEGSTLKKTDTIDSTTTGSWTYTMDTATTSTTTFKAIVKYTKSNDADDQQTKTASINFYFNKFYGGVADLNPSEATVEALTSALATGKGGTYSFTVSAGRICYAYPKSLGALSSIKDGNGFSLFDSFTRTEQTYTQAGQSVAYYRYVLTDPTTVSGYNVIFA